jgi:3-methylfumaryl-CoA hydratase
LASFDATLAPHLAAVGKIPTVPLGLHWCLAPEIVAGSKLGPDGHPALGEFLPLLPKHRRMLAAGEIRFLGPLRPGDRVRRRAILSSIQEKEGRSGTLCFASIEHHLESESGPVIDERQVIVYRPKEASGPNAPAQADHLDTDARREIVPIDPVILFRYSALTFNGHRIHYDFPYATEVEQHAGLVIHGPLQATLLLNFAAKVRGEPPASFSFQCTRPATGAQSLTLCAIPTPADDLALQVRSEDGSMTMKASASW